MSCSAFRSLKPLPPNPLAAKFASQSDAHMKTDAQIKFLYYPLIGIE